ncbi:DUF1365 domain-containing protein [Roseibium salinum]|uniref:DUF1365 domain-containing protein n=1 Tax=Roseibium salinum TaxID=1604349 RepID=A0ABT3QWT1_9HYPH|nr:DUF1365 domain-containing protein [Roseibium sp. DSM 29163]MCX2721357.1 DUF1365 domain-containing protein [Roseibium sp. DSM 29163]
MTTHPAAIYDGTVMHTRMRPCVHKLRYRVFAVLIDCGDLEKLGQRLKLFSYNRFNLFSIHDRDHGDGTPLPDYLARLAAVTPAGREVCRFAMLCYPRILGYAFNPLTVYFGFDEGGHPRLMVYEVNNTFGERKTYVIPVSPANGSNLIVQSCRKELYVSPFNTAEGTYGFRVTPPGEELTVGITLKDVHGPLLKALFHGKRKELSDSSLLRALARTGWMTVKVTAGIYLEAARLWRKGLRLKPRPPAPEAPVTYVSDPGRRSRTDRAAGNG